MSDLMKNNARGDESREGEFSLRFRLRIQKNNGHTGKLAVIMAYPAFAAEDPANEEAVSLSASYNTDIGHEGELQDIGEVSVVHLFPLCVGSSSKLADTLELFENEHGAEKLNRVLKHNRKVVATAIKEADYVVLAWGDTPKKVADYFYMNEALKALKTIKKAKKAKRVFVAGSALRKAALTQRGNPRQAGKAEEALSGLVEVGIDKLNRLFMIDQTAVAAASE
ncbi:DUF1643 domain-containing protein [Paenibacillus sp. NPDC058071]|uniref:DUF1643 domain-containing protein n=1 Tax=Paenibacillus sp. NPDC058071 TaxID=3346326 RepID=UPI0036D9ADA1